MSTATNNSGPSSLMALKLQSQARDDEEKAKAKRKKGALVAVYHFLMDCGFGDTCSALERESGLPGAKMALADNISLLQIIAEYEQYYDMRFGHKPKLYRVPDAATAAGVRSYGGGEGERERPSRASGATGVSRVGSTGRLDPGKDKPEAAGGGSRASGTGGYGSKTGARADRGGGDRPRAALTPPSEAGMDLMPTTSAVRLSSKDEQPQRPNGGGPGGKQAGVVAAPAGDETDGFGGAQFAARQRLMRPHLPEWTGESRELAQIIQRDILDNDPNVRWGDVAALDDAKQLLKEAVVMPSKYPQFFTGRLKPWRGILLFGPPGTGKTMLAKAVATECNTTFFNISASSIVSKWRGDSEKLIRMLFEMARHYSPSTIFLDELDSIMSHRSSGGQEHEGSRRMKTELLIQMDGLQRELEPTAQVFVLGASNIPWDLDDAILRRLEKRILVGLPTAPARVAIFKSNLEGHIKEDGVDLEELAERTDGYTGSDINVICREAMMRTVRSKMKKLEAFTAAGNTEALERELVSLDNVTASDLMHALSATKAASHSIPVSRYIKWNNERGSNRSGYSDLD